MHLVAHVVQNRATHVGIFGRIVVEGIACGTAAAWLELNLPNEHDLGWAGGLSALVVPAGASALVLALLWLSALPTALQSSGH